MVSGKEGSLGEDNQDIGEGTEDPVSDQQWRDVGRALTVDRTLVVGERTLRGGKGSPVEVGDSVASCSSRC